MRKRNYFSLIAGILFLLTVLVSCEYEHPEDEIIIPGYTVSFSKEIIPYFNASCNMSGCHSAGGIKPDLTPANAYTSLFAHNQIDTISPENSILYKKIKTGGSMSNYSTTSKTNMVLTWIKQGAKNN